MPAVSITYFGVLLVRFRYSLFDRNQTLRRSGVRVKEVRSSVKEGKSVIELDMSNFLTTN